MVQKIPLYFLITYLLLIIIIILHLYYACVSYEYYITCMQYIYTYITYTHVFGLIIA